MMDANEDELIMTTMKPDDNEYEYPVVIIILWAQLIITRCVNDNEW